MTNWDAIVKNDGPMVWRTLWRLLADRADMEECFQETFLSALNYSRRQEVECWPALLCTLATARAMDRLRNRYRGGDGARDNDSAAGRSDGRLTERASTEAGPEENAIATELSERLRHALSQLPERQAEMFYLHGLCGWSHREIGDSMEMTENAAGVAIHRARQRLRELLNDDS